MFKITKCKGNDYKTDDADKAQEAYTNCNKSISMYYDDNIVKSKIMTAYGQAHIWNKLERKMR